MLVQDEENGNVLSYDMILSNIKLLHDINIDQKFCLYLDLNCEPIFRLFPKNTTPRPDVIKLFTSVIY